jgi:L-alanine-DL-glutamate epimerase-like enolase superfamily enzyme
VKLKRIDAGAYRIPTEKPEADGTFGWDSTTLVVVTATSDSGHRGLGFTYAAASAATLVRERLAEVAVGSPVEAVGMAWERMVAAVRNVGRPGVGAMAISAVDVALWDLKARVVDLPLFRLLGAYRDKVPIYASGGFTTDSEEELCRQLSDWVSAGIPRVKMKVGLDGGTRPDQDEARVAAARRAIGAAELFVDANGAYSAKQAVEMGSRFANHGVTYFEEPVSSDQLDQLAFVRERVPMAVAAGEYGYDPWYFREMLQVRAVDILQADATRSLGITGWLQAAALSYAFGVPFSAHTAPAIHAHAACAAPQIEHAEYFHDHVRIERMLFDGVTEPVDGFLRPDPGRPGLGLEFRARDAERWSVQ